MSAPLSVDQENMVKMPLRDRFLTWQWGFTPLRTMYAAMKCLFQTLFEMMLYSD